MNLWNTHLKKRLLCMGLDPLTHKPLSSSSFSDPSKPHSASVSTRHMAQWESARLEAEARLSKDTSHYSSNFFLHLWNSEVGDAFRNMESVSSPGRSSSSTKCTTITASFSAQAPTTCAIVRSKTEARLSKDTSHYSSDFFLRLWNSEVRDAFCNMKDISSPARSSSSTKYTATTASFSAQAPTTRAIVRSKTETQEEAVMNGQRWL